MRCLRRVDNFLPFRTGALFLSILFVCFFVLSACTKNDPIDPGSSQIPDPGQNDNDGNDSDDGGTSVSPYLHTDGKVIKDGDNKPVILRGIGIGGWMIQEPYMLQAYMMTNQTDIRNHIEELIGEEETNEFYNAYLSNGVQEADIQQLKDWGFNSVRIPLHYNLFTLPVDEEQPKTHNTWLDKGFKLLDSVVNWCAAHHIYAILDLHAAPGGQGNDLPIADRDPSKPLLWQSQYNKEKTIALWKKLAERYKENKWVGGYDLLNEPNVDFNDLNNQDAHSGGDNQPLWTLLKNITTAIRTVDPHHIIFIEGNGWANNYNGFPGPWDDNMVISFHRYQYQGDKGNTEAEIQNFLDMRDQYNIPLWCGETGENNDNWYRKMVDLMERNLIGWSFWPVKKIGADNCPMKIIMPSGFQHILDYWSGNDNKPSEEEAYNTLMQLADNYKFENCVKQKHVINALFK